MSESNGKARIDPPMHHAGDLINRIIAAEQTMDYHHERLQEARAEHSRLTGLLNTLMRSDPDRIIVHPPRAYVLSNGVLTQAGVSYANEVPLEPEPSCEHVWRFRGDDGGKSWSSCARCGALRQQDPDPDPVPGDNFPVLDRSTAGLLTAAHDGGP